MKKIIFLIFILVYFFISTEIFASSAKSVVETRVEGEEVEVYQSVETTVDGETVKKESNQPGKLELEMKREGEQKPTVIFSQESNYSSPTINEVVTPIPRKENKLLNYSLITRKITNFFQNIWLNLTKWLKK